MDAKRLNQEFALDDAVRRLFERYEEVFNRALAGRVQMDNVSALYAEEFIAASPAGVKTGKNDTALQEAMTKGYQRYRDIGTKGIRVRALRTSPIDENHALAHVAWTACYARAHAPDVSIDFDVHYLVAVRNGQARVFGWIAGDEDATLRARPLRQR